jgi:hypothetical protein
MDLPTALRTVLADPVTHDRLHLEDGVLRARSGAWPVLGGVPVLVPSVHAFVAARREGLIAALVDNGLWTEGDADLLAGFVAGARTTAPELEVSDFLADEEGPVDVLPGPSASLVTLLTQARTLLPEQVAARVGRGRVLEVGCGAGTVTRRMRGPRVVVDRSLRALLQACEDPDALPVVGDASALPVRSGVFATVVAANVVDVLPDPDTFLTEAHRVLRAGGRLVLSTPDPALGSTSDDTLELALVAAGFAIDEVLDGIPWVRSHGPRHHQLYVVRLVVATRA